LSTTHTSPDIHPNNDRHPATTPLARRTTPPRATTPPHPAKNPPPREKNPPKREKNPHNREKNLIIAKITSTIARKISDSRVNIHNREITSRIASTPLQSVCFENPKILDTI